MLRKNRDLQVLENNRLFREAKGWKATGRTIEDVRNFRLVERIRTRLYGFLKEMPVESVSIQDIGCSIEELKAHLESQFDSKMSWENYGVRGWHIDHIKPLSMFDLKDRKQYLEASNFKNLRPLWWRDNLSKGGRRGKQIRGIWNT